MVVRGALPSIEIMWVLAWLLVIYIRFFRLVVGAGFAVVFYLAWGWLRSVAVGGVL